MKIVALQGSPKKKGNTATLLGWIEEELKSLGHDVESIYLNSKEIHGCLACDKCKEKTKNIEPSKVEMDKTDKGDIINKKHITNNINIIDRVGCVQNDAASIILEKMVNAQLVIFASPIYFWGFTAQIKALIDRTYSLYTNYHKPDHASLVEGQRQAVLLTGGGSYENNVEGVLAAFSRLQNPLRSVKAGELFIGKCTTPDMLDISAKKQAIEFARSIVA